MSTFRPLRILFLLLVLCAIAAYSVPLAQDGENFVLTVTAATVTVRPSTATRAPQPASTAHQQSDLEENIVKYVANPRRRGTVGIIMSCILTLFLCVWTTIAVNIEPPIHVRKGAHWIAKLDQLCAKRNVRKIGWSLTSLMFPEMAMSVAAFERRTALLLQVHLREIFDPMWKEKLRRKEVNLTPEGEEPPNPWKELSLSYFAVMGGFRVVYSKNRQHAAGVAPAQEGQQEVSKLSAFDYEEGSPSGAVRPGSETPDRKDFTETSLVSQPSVNDPELAESGPRREPAGFVQGLFSGTHPYDWSQVDPVTDEAGGTLTPHGVLWIARKGWLPVDAISPEFVKDKSKVNALAKVLVCLQAGWMIIQALGRLAAGQEVTLIELHTVLHALCAGTMYITWFSKPVDIDLPIEIYLTDQQFAELKNAGSEPNPTNPFSRGKLFPRKGIPAAAGEEDKKYVTSRAGLGKLMYQQLSKGKNIFVSITDLGDAFGRIISGRANLVWEGTCVCTVGLIYGGVHLATWNNHFETEFEKVAWKACSVITAVAILGFVLELCIGALIKFIEWETIGEGGTADAVKTPTGVEETPAAADVHPFPAEVEKTPATHITAAPAAGPVPSSKPRKTMTNSSRPGKAPRPVKKFGKKRDKLYWTIYKLIVGSTSFLGFIVLIFARCFLLVESFIALRGQPDGVYNTVNWVESIPHLS
ncbi:hypothetical protein BZA05DRAFT_476009 [Tricharina praecox]|uniref:uncharacterized protein n=1 Tax=Tricharina praecox TaxID=43433 RepID=UPI0022209FD3|nr:uncharacterized protein BZA05DRAFT_476009 [Tricharina praecox]KAI5846653.1 hypothetical protein BZA05DRAFT_476009 [Tricharina praecox]